MIGIEAKQYFVFPWADGGNLWELWEDHDSHQQRSDIARQCIPRIVEQLVGLTGALAKLHDLGNGKASSYRHGDLKPENILIFDKHKFPGIWKLADLGLAKYHMEATGDRINPTSTAGGGTISYQPPESARPKSAPTSRLYDIWSMGCIILQLMTWLVYGTGNIKQLTRETQSVFKRESSYWKASWSDGRGLHNIHVHPFVKQHMKQMRHDVGGSKALLDLLSVVEYRLLVIELPPSARTSKSGCRINAEGLHQSLLRIQAEGRRDPAYWISGRNPAKQASTLELPQGRGFGAAGGNDVSSNSSISSLQIRTPLTTYLYTHPGTLKG